MHFFAGMMKEALVDQPTTKNPYCFRVTSRSP